MMKEEVEVEMEEIWIRMNKIVTKGLSVNNNITCSNNFIFPPGHFNDMWNK